MPVANAAENFVIDIGATFKALYGYTPVAIPSLGGELQQFYPKIGDKFSVPSPPTPPGAANPYNTGTNAFLWERPQLGGISPLYGLSDMIGREVFMPITLVVNDPVAGQVSYDFPFSLVSVRNKKLIKETPMVERGGSVIEETGMGAWEIDMKGFLIDGNDQFPDDQLQQLNQLYVTNQVAAYISTVQIKCALTDLVLGSNANVVITELELPMKAKVIGVRDFSMKMIQDSILTLYPNSINQNTQVDPAIVGAH